MPKFFCDYCDVYLTHDSMSVRKAHNAGRNHLRNVVEYYQQIGHEKAQSVIDSITSSYAESGQANPMLAQPGPMGFGAPPGFPPPLPGLLNHQDNPSEWMLTKVLRHGTTVSARRTGHDTPSEFQRPSKLQRSSSSSWPKPCLSSLLSHERAATSEYAFPWWFTS
jgi:hypothetical protein